MIINEIFYGTQGEIDIGKPSIFIRLSGCNLNCKWCDTAYHKEGKQMTIKQIIKEVKKYPCKTIVITGGEPLLQGDELITLIEELNDYTINLETNGTIIHDVLYMFDNISCSLKKQMIIPEVVEDLRMLEDLRFKFVYESKDDLWWEDLIIKYSIDPKKVWIMPEGATKKEQLSKMEEVEAYCLEKGLNFSPRMHVLIHDDKRGV